MQGKLLAAALVATFPLAVSAQSSVTVYGVADAAIAAEDTGAPDGSRTVINSGNQSSSRIGFRGTEDLGSGLKALFNLEAGVALDSGAGDSALFGRRAVVGLEGSFGQLTVGREYSPIADIANATDINGQGFYGSNLSAFTTGRLTRRLSNSVNYKSPSLSGFKINGAYSAGETQTGASLDLMGVSATFSSGDLYAGLGYHVYERATTGDDKEMIVGLGYKMGAVEFKANYLSANPTGNNNKFEQMNVGASYSFGPSKVLANLQRNELENGAKGNGYNIAYIYTMSKRTNLYANYASISNNNTGLFGLVAASTNTTPPAGALGADPSALSLGIRHTF